MMQVSASALVDAAGDALATDAMDSVEVFDKDALADLEQRVMTPSRVLDLGGWTLDGRPTQDLTGRAVKAHVDRFERMMRRAG